MLLYLLDAEPPFRVGHQDATQQIFALFRDGEVWGEVVVHIDYPLQDDVEALLVIAVPRSFKWILTE